MVESSKAVWRWQAADVIIRDGADAWMGRSTAGLSRIRFGAADVDLGISSGGFDSATREKASG
jgi:hypothetical protein